MQTKCTAYTHTPRTTKLCNIVASNTLQYMRSVTTASCAMQTSISYLMCRCSCERHADSHDQQNCCFEKTMCGALGTLHHHAIHTRVSVIHTRVSKKTYQLWNGIARNYKYRFWSYLAEIFRRLWNRVCMLQFSCRFNFINFSSSNSKPDTENNANHDSVSSKCAWRGAIF